MSDPIPDPVNANVILALKNTRFLRTQDNPVRRSDPKYRRAIREFQRYASMNFAALETPDATRPVYVDRLTPVDIRQPVGGVNVRYGGPLHGQDDATTLGLLDRWSRANLRCPVVINAYYREQGDFTSGDPLRGVSPVENGENLWDWNDREPRPVPRKKGRSGREPLHYVAFDFSKHFAVTAEDKDKEKLTFVVGQYNSSRLGGPESTYAVGASRGETELTERRMTGVEFASPDPSVSQPGVPAGLKRAVRVVRAVAEVENFAFADIINAYDTGIISFGPCQWTLRGSTSLTSKRNVARLANKIKELRASLSLPVTRNKNQIRAQLAELEPARGELGGFLAYLRTKNDPATGRGPYERLVTSFGLEVTPEWGADGRELFQTNRTYTAEVRHRISSGTENDFATIPVDEQVHFSGWHWVHRFQMAARKFPDVPRAMFEMTRRRLRDILTVEFRTGSGGLGLELDGTPPPAARFGDAFRTEAAMTVLLRAHVKAPGRVVERRSNETSGPAHESTSLARCLREIIGKCKLKRNPQRWPTDVACIPKQPLHAFIAQRLHDHARGWVGDAAKTVTEAKEWPYYKGRRLRGYAWPRLGPGQEPVPPHLGPPLSTDALTPAEVLEVIELESAPDLFDSLSAATAASAALAADAETVAPAASDRAVSVIRAFNGGEALLSIISRPIPGGRTFNFVVEGSPETTPTNAELVALLRATDRLVFMDANPTAEGDETTLWNVPVIPRTLSALIRNAGTAAARIDDITFRTRAFVRPHDQTPDSEDLTRARVTAEIRHGAAGPEFHTFSLEPFGTLTGPFPMAALRNRHLTRTFIIRGFTQPVLLDFLSFPTAQTPSNVRIEASATFAANDNAPVALVLESECLLSRQLTDNDRFDLRPFGLIGRDRSIRHNLFPRKTPLLVAFTKIRQRPAAEPQVDTWGVWEFEVELPHQPAARAWNELVLGPMLTSLTNVQGGRDVTFIPRLDDAPLGPNSEGSNWVATFEVAESSPRAGAVETAHLFILPTTGSATVPANRITLLPLRLTPRDALDVIATFPGLRTFDQGGAAGPAHRTRCRLSRPPREAGFAEEALRAGLITFAYEELAARTPARERRVRLGALGLSLPAHAASDDQVTESTAARPTGVGWARLSYEETNLPRIDPSATHRVVNLPLTALDIFAVGEDPLPGEDAGRAEEALTGVPRLQSPLLITAPLPSGVLQTHRTAYVLRAAESAGPDWSHLLALRLARVGDSTIRTDLLVIDPEPMLVARVRVEDTSDLASLAITNEIGNWGEEPSGGARWQMSLAGARYTILLPSQGIGEAMHRAADAGDITPGRPTDVQFGPGAEVTLLSSEFQQRFTEVPWNLRLNLGFPGQRSPGSPIERLRFELVYGMSCVAEPRDARLAELQARLGRPPAGLQPTTPWRPTTSQSRFFNAFRTAFRRSLTTSRSRLAVLEPWSETAVGRREAEREERPPFRLSSDDRLVVSLRRHARLAYPTPALPPEGVPAGGLKGSYAWAFESANIYNKVWTNPASFAAEVEGLLFSSLGGWGHMRASFDLGATTIDATVSCGRIETLVLERIGRVSLFWNRARHVIVYERTTAPSEQFAVEQHPLLGLPLPRKTEEYVEILEPSRKLAAEGRQTQELAQARGFVAGCEFPGGQPPHVPPRILVNSRWGSDVNLTSTDPVTGRDVTTPVGWKVPLWLPSAPASIYPKPDLRFLCEDDLRGEPTAVPCQDPDRLYFYTHTAGNLGPQTDAWPPIFGVDYGIGSAAAAEDGGAVPVGAGDFTFRVGRSLRLPDLVANRAGRPAAARLTTVTVMRGPLQAAAVPPAGTGGEVAARQAAAGVSEVLRSGLARVLGAVESPAEGEPEVFQLSSEARPVPAALARAVRDAFAGARTRLLDAHRLFGDALGSAAEQQQRYLARAIEKTAARLRLQHDLFAAEALRETSRLMTDAVSAFWQLARVLHDEAPQADYAAARPLLRTILREIFLAEGDEDEPGTLAERLLRVPGSPGEALARAESFLSAAALLKDETTAAIDSTRCWVCESEDATPVAERLQRLEELVAALRDRSSALAAAADAPWRRWVGDRVSSVAEQSAAARSTLDVAMAALAFAARRDDWRAVATAALTDAERAVSAHHMAARDAVNQMIASVGPVVRRLAAELSQVAGQVLEQLEAAVINARNWEELLGGTDALAEALLAQATADLRRGLELLRGRLISEAEEIVGSVLPSFASLRTAADRALAGASDAVADAIEGLGLTDAEVRRAVEDLLAQASAALDPFKAHALSLLPAGLPRLLPTSQAEPVLRLMRAFGDAARVPGLDFARTALEGVEYRFVKPLQDAGTQLGHTATALMTQLEAAAGAAAGAVGERLRELSPIDLSIPTREIADRFLPDVRQLRNRLLSEVFDNVGGIPFRNLFRNIRLPSDVAKGITISQQIDPQTRSGRVFINMAVNLTDPDPVTVFSLAGVTLRLMSARMAARVEVSGSAGGSLRTRASGEIVGDWDLQIGGFPIVTVERTTLRFDDEGHLRFEVSPDRIKLKQALEFVTKLLEAFGSSKSGLSIRLRPGGVETVLYLPLPPIQSGTFGIANLVLGFRLGLSFADEFMITAGFSVGLREAPFTLTVFILGGAGWVFVDLDYTPRTGRLNASVSVALFASASLAVSLGPISGGVYAYFGITADYTTRGGGSLAIGIMLLLSGRVSLLGIIEVGMSLMLLAQYTSGGGLVGRGRVSYEIKIGPFFSIEVSADVEYRFGSAARARALATEVAPSQPAALALPLSIESGTGLPAAESVLVTDTVLAHYREAASKYLGMFEAGI